MFILYNEAIEKAMREDPYIPPPPPLVDDINKPLAFQSEKDGSTVTLKKSGSQLSAWGGFEISRDGGEWEDYTVSTPITLNRGHYVSFRTKTTAGVDHDSFWQFFVSGKINAYNNINSMVSADFLNLSELAPYQFHHLFDDCTALYKAPQLPATTLADSCYRFMFRGCTSLTSVPQLPATTLAERCYSSMFDGCTSLTSAPQLPATTLADSCYSFMFSDCTSLTSAPQLPATTLATNCYNTMFWGCSKLKKVRVSATTTATNAMKSWLYNVSATGDFYCDPNATIFPTGASGIPKGWTRHALADYPQT